MRRRARMRAANGRLAAATFHAVEDGAGAPPQPGPRIAHLPVGVDRRRSTGRNRARTPAGVRSSGAPSEMPGTGLALLLGPGAPPLACVSRRERRTREPAREREPFGDLSRMQSPVAETRASIHGTSGAEGL